MKIDEVIARTHKDRSLEKYELCALIDYIAYLEFGYVSLQRPDMVSTAKVSADKRLEDWKKAYPPDCKCGAKEECDQCC